MPVPPPAKMVRGQPSWLLRNDSVEAAVTKTGAQVGPVRFRLGRRWIEPLSVAPWAEEKHAIPPMLQALRGDFFCAPFGGNATAWKGETHPPHGETANRQWRLRSPGEDGALRLSLATRVRRGEVRKAVILREGNSAVYQQHALRLSGPMCFGHHAMLHFPATPGSGRLSTSRLMHGQVFPGDFEDPAAGGYSVLQPGAEFSSLRSVTRRDGKTADLSRYPAREGYEDLVLLVHEASPDFAWSAVVFAKEGYVFFTLKDPRVLRSTVLWHSNGGRHYPPWQGRHRAVLGLEDVTAYFHYGLAESVRPNRLSRAGYPTAIALDAAKPLLVNYIFGVAAVPGDFDVVKSIQRENSGIQLIARSGSSIRAAIDLPFLYETRER